VKIIDNLENLLVGISSSENDDTAQKSAHDLECFIKALYIIRKCQDLVFSREFFPGVFPKFDRFIQTHLCLSGEI